MNNGLPIAVNKGDTTNLTGLTKRDGFTTNKNYLGHNEQGIPYYFDPHLKEGEIKYIMANEFKKLNDGSYEAKVEQVIRKHGKDTEGKEDLNKEIISLELNVKGKTECFYYINFCVKGYSEEQCKYANEDLERLMQEFKVTIPEELAGKIGIVTAKTKPDGSSAMYFNAPRTFFDWTTLLTLPNSEGTLPCKVKKFYAKGNKRIFIVDINANGNIVEEFIPYDLDNAMRKQSYKWVLGKLNLHEGDISSDLNDCNALVVVKRVDKDGHTYINKRIAFPRKENRKPNAW